MASPLLPLRGDKMRGSFADSLAGWLARSLAPFLSLFLEFPLLSRIGGRYLARRRAEAGGREGAGHSRGTVTFSDCRKHFVRSFAVRRSFVKATLVRRPSVLRPPLRRAAVEGDHSFRGRSVYAAAAPAPLFFPTVAWLTMQTRRGRERGNGVAEEATEESNYTSSSSAPQAISSSHSPFSGPLLALFPSPADCHICLDVLGGGHLLTSGIPSLRDRDRLWRRQCLC